MFEFFGGKLATLSVVMVGAVVHQFDSCGGGIFTRESKVPTIAVEGPDRATFGVAETYTIRNQGFGTVECPEVVNFSFESNYKLATKQTVVDPPTRIVRGDDGSSTKDDRCEVTVATARGSFNDDFGDGGIVRVQLLAAGGLTKAEGTKHVKVSRAPAGQAPAPVTPNPEPTPPVATTPGGSGQASRPTPAFASSLHTDAGDYSHDVAVGDLGIGPSGRRDVVVTEDDPADALKPEGLYLFPTQADGSLGAAVFVPLPAGSDPRGVLVTDLDGDSDRDIAVALSGSSSVGVVLNDGAGNFALDGVQPATGGAPIEIAAGDMDGNGTTDLVTANATGNSITVLARGADSYVSRSFPLGGSGFGVALADFDENGRLDVAAGRWNTGEVVVLRNVPDSSTWKLQAPVVAATPPAGVDRWPQGIAAGNIDGVRGPDIAVAYHGTDQLGVLKKSDGSIGAFGEVTYTTGAGPYDVVLRDLNGDNETDVTVTNAVASDARVFPNTGNDGTLASPVPVPAHFAPTGANAGDLDGDGKADLVLANADGTVTVALNRTPAARRTAARAAAANDAVARDAQRSRGRRLSISRLRFTPVSEGRTSFGGDGTGHIRGMTVRGELRGRVGGRGRLPRGVREALNVTFAGRMDADRYFAPPVNPVLTRGVLVGRSRSDRRTAVCVSIRSVIRGGVASHTLRLIGGTGKASRLKLELTGLPVISFDAPVGRSDMRVVASDTKRPRTLSRTCRTLLRRAR